MFEPCANSCGQCVECLVYDLYRCRAPYYFCANRCGCCVQCIYAQRMSCIVPAYQVVTRSCPWYADPFSPVKLVCVEPPPPPQAAQQAKLEFVADALVTKPGAIKRFSQRAKAPHPRPGSKVAATTKSS